MIEIKFTPFELETIQSMVRSSYECERDASKSYDMFPVRERILFARRARAWKRIGEKLERELKNGKQKR